MLNGKIDKCHSTRTSRYLLCSRSIHGRLDQNVCGEGAIRWGVVWSNRLGKLTKSRQLSARSWVTDFQQPRHVYVYTCIHIRLYTCHYAGVCARSFAYKDVQTLLRSLQPVRTITPTCDLLPVDSFVEVIFNRRSLINIPCK